MVSSNLVFPIEMTVTTILQQGMIGSKVAAIGPPDWSKKLHRSWRHLNYVSKGVERNLTHDSIAAVPG